MIDELLEAGLGLEKDTLRLARTTSAWIDAGERLRDLVAAELVGLVADVEQIGSSSVADLLAKPTPPDVVDRQQRDVSGVRATGRQP